MESVLDTVINPAAGTTIRQEAEDFLTESIDHLKSRLKKAGLENEEIAARITKMLAEADHRRQQARVEKARAEDMEFTRLVRSLRLVLSAQRLFSGDLGATDDPLMRRLDNFERTLAELSGDRRG